MRERHEGHIVACLYCDLVQRIPSLPPGATARCPRCGHAVAFNKPGSLDRTMALTLAAAILLILANVEPLMGLSVSGRHASTTILGRAKEGRDDTVPCILEPQGDEKAFRRNWARLIQKIYEIDPLICPQCKGAMRIISSIDDRQVIRAILEHLGLWLVRARPPPKIHAPPSVEFVMDDHSQIPINDDHYYRDPEYPWDAYIQA